MFLVFETRAQPDFIAELIVHINDNTFVAEVECPRIGLRTLVRKREGFKGCASNADFFSQLVKSANIHAAILIETTLAHTVLRAKTCVIQSGVSQSGIDSEFLMNRKTDFRTDERAKGVETIAKATETASKGNRNIRSERFVCSETIVSVQIQRTAHGIGTKLLSKARKSKENQKDDKYVGSIFHVDIETSDKFRINSCVRFLKVFKTDLVINKGIFDFPELITFFC